MGGGGGGGKGIYGRPLSRQSDDEHDDVSNGAGYGAGINGDSDDDDDDDSTNVKLSTRVEKSLVPMEKRSSLDLHQTP